MDGKTYCQIADVTPQFRFCKVKCFPQDSIVELTMAEASRRQNANKQASIPDHIASLRPGILGRKENDVSLHASQGQTLVHFSSHFMASSSQTKSSIAISQHLIPIPIPVPFPFSLPLPLPLLPMGPRMIVRRRRCRCGDGGAVVVALPLAGRLVVV